MTFRRAKMLASAGLGIVITTWHHLVDAGDRCVRSDRPIAGGAGGPNGFVGPVGRLVPHWIVRVLSAADWCRRWIMNTRDAAELSCVGGIDGPGARGCRRLGDGDGPGAEGDVGGAGAYLYRWR